MSPTFKKLSPEMKKWVETDYAKYLFDMDGTEFGLLSEDCFDRATEKDYIKPRIPRIEKELAMESNSVELRISLGSTYCRYLCKVMYVPDILPRKESFHWYLTEFSLLGRILTRFYGSITHFSSARSHSRSFSISLLTQVMSMPKATSFWTFS